MPEKKRDPLTTLAICVSCLILSIPVPGVAINLESTFMPPMPLKEADTILQTPHFALYGGAILDMTAGVVVMLGSILLRHMTPNNTFVGLVTFGLAALNSAAQLVVLGIVYITNQTHLESKSKNEVKFVDGQFDTNGRQFTRESWSCMMGNLYVQMEPWSTNACSEYHYARYTTILMSVTASLLLGIAYWPVRNYIFGRSEYVSPYDMQKPGNGDRKN